MLRTPSRSSYSVANHGGGRHRAQLILLAAGAVAVLAGVVAWVLNVSTFDRWLEIHTGVADSTSPYYAFWSGFGSDIAEFGLVGAAFTGVYQLNRKFNCHQHGCWRIGTHPAAGGQFLLCYRHHPDYQGKKPSRELIERVHRQHVAREEAVDHKLNEIHERLGGTGRHHP
jgi:hypothetical protein